MSVNSSISPARLLGEATISYFRPTKSNVDNFDDNYDFNGKVIVIGLRVKRFDNFMPRVMRKRLRVNFHNFDHNFAHVAREQSPFLNV